MAAPEIVPWRGTEGIKWEALRAYPGNRTASPYESLKAAAVNVWWDILGGTKEKPLQPHERLQGQGHNCCR